MQPREALMVLIAVALAAWLVLRVGGRQLDAVAERAAERERAVREGKATDAPQPPVGPTASIIGGLLGLVVLLVLFVAALAFPPVWVALFVGLMTPLVAAQRGSPNFLPWWALGAVLPLVSVLFALMVSDRRRETDLKWIAERLAAADAPAGGVRQSAALARFEKAQDEEDFDPFDTPAATGYPSWVAGIAHRPAEVRARLARLVPDAPLVLVRDPFNAVDPRAVKVYAGGDHIGYVPARHIAWVSERMDSDKPVLARVHSIERVDSNVTAVWTRLFLS